MLDELEAGNRRVTGLNNDTDETFETEITRRDNPWRAYLTIIEGCDKACAYCVVPYTRGPERSRGKRIGVGGSAATGGPGIFRSAAAGQTVNSYTRISTARRMTFSELLLAVADVRGDSARAIHDFASAGFWTQTSWRRIDAEPKLVRSRSFAGAIGLDAIFCAAMARTYTRDEYLEKIAIDARRRSGRSVLPRTLSWDSRARRRRTLMRR